MNGRMFIRNSLVQNQAFFREGIIIKRLLIVGASGHGRCCLDIAREQYDEVYFLDDNPDIYVVNDSEIIGTIDEMSSFYLEYTKIFIAVGNNILREKLIKQAIEIGYEVVTLISNQSSVSPFSSIGIGSVVFPNTVIEANAVIGKGCIIAANVTINHDAVINDYCLVNSNSVIRPNVTLGQSTTVSAHCIISMTTVLKPFTYIEDGSIITREGSKCITEE